MLFYLGTHHPHWLAKAGVPLFVSHGQLRRYVSLPRAIARWALDSRGFSELSQHGRWTITPADYVSAVRRYRDEIGMLDWASIQDWMCEPAIRQKTGLTVEEHQKRTVENWLELRDLAPEIPWLPVLQGWTAAEYMEHVFMYDFNRAPWRDGVVGLGSICRRQSLTWVHGLIRWLASSGLKIHAFGFKITGLETSGALLHSSDSTAWSMNARRNPKDAATGACRATHQNCANCLPYALAWRKGLLDRSWNDARRSTANRSPTEEAASSVANTSGPPPVRGGIQPAGGRGRARDRAGNSPALPRRAAVDLAPGRWGESGSQMSLQLAPAGGEKAGG
jgi:hypothetical protein